MDKEKIVKNLIKLRGEKKQAEVAKAIGVGQSTYAMYETGKRIPSDEVKIKIARYYNTTVQNIFFDQDLTKSDKRGCL